MEIQSPHNSLIQKPSLVLVLFFVCFSFWFVDFWRPIGEDLFKEHPELYHRYAYLPSIFLNKGSYAWDKNTIEKHKLNPELKSTYNYGSAALYAPFFFGALLFSELNHLDIEQGFSSTFQDAIHWSGIFYCLLALILLRLLLLRYFNEKTVALTLFVCFFGTSLFYYSFVLSEMPECQLLFLSSLFFYLTHIAIKKSSYFITFLMGMVLALVALIRLFDVYILFVYFLFNIYHLDDFKTRMRISLKHALIFLFAVVLLWLPQIVFNQQFYHLFYNPFSRFNGYDFADSRIGAVIFSYKQGWLTYSPILIFSIVGLFFMDAKLPFSKAGILLVLFLIIVVYGASWDWRNGHYFSARKLCTSVVWLSLPFASFVAKIFQAERNTLLQVFYKYLFVALIFSSFLLMAAQCYLSITHRLVPANMSQTMYWNLFRQFQF